VLTEALCFIAGIGLGVSPDPGSRIRLSAAGGSWRPFSLSFWVELTFPFDPAPRLLPAADPKEKNYRGNLLRNSFVFSPVIETNFDFNTIS
jgi:hypothetical protein